MRAAPVVSVIAERELRALRRRKRRAGQRVDGRPEHRRSEPIDCGRWQRDLRRSRRREERRLAKHNQGEAGQQPTPSPDPVGEPPAEQLSSKLRGAVCGQGVARQRCSTAMLLGKIGLHGNQEHENECAVHKEGDEQVRPGPR